MRQFTGPRPWPAAVYLFPVLCGLLGSLSSLVPRACAEDAPAAFDLIISGGLVYDGTLREPRQADVGVVGDTIAAVGDLSRSPANQRIDARGMTVTPGFINMLSWAAESLLHDGRSQSDIRQGVTLEVFGEGWSMGPLNPAMQRDRVRGQSDVKYDVDWSTLAEFLDKLVRRGISPNVASLVGATTVRIHALGYANREPDAQELRTMRDLVRREMESGALGVGASLIYAPATYAKTEELIALCQVAAPYGGLYMSHLRSEGNRLVEATDELIRISRTAGIPAHIYHLKAAGRENWPKLDQVIERVEAARAGGLRITADVYPYTAAATGLNAAMPPWVQEGGFRRFRERLREPEIRRRVAAEMRTPAAEWENLLVMAGSAENVLLVGFKCDELKHLTGKSLAEVARQRQQTPEETAVDLIVEDGSRIECIYFLMSEENVRKTIALPWVAFCSDSPSLAPEGVFLSHRPHPRAYGSFARLLSQYTRSKQVVPWPAAIHRLTGLPARTLGLRRRGLLQPGYFADIVVLDPATIQDHATYENPHQYATGVRDVLVNGRMVLHRGEHTGAAPGRVVRGPGVWRASSRRGMVHLSDEGRRIHQAGFVFDGHNDLPWEIRTRGSRSFERLDLLQPQPQLHTDIPRLRKGNVGAQFWSVYVPADTARTGQALLQTLEQIDLVHAMLERYGDVFEKARTAADVRRIQAAGKIASLIGVEGGHAIEDSLENLRRLRSLGAAYMTLTHSDSLNWADSATDEARHGGLSAFGEEVVREMNRLGMLVDLSHVSAEVMHDALRVSAAPVIFSHSCARAIADHPRNVPDDVLMRLEGNGGLVMVNFFSGFVVPEAAQRLLERSALSARLKAELPDEQQVRKALSQWDAQHPLPQGTVHDVADHIDHLVRVAGVEHVGIGSDFDGVTTLPVQLEDVGSYPILTQELLNRGYTAAEIHAFMSQNMLRVLERVEAVAAQSQ